MSARQVDDQGRLRHLLTLDGLPRDVLLRLLDRAQALQAQALAGGSREILAGKAVCTLFFEPSTRTRSSFQLAATRLGADVLNFDASTSSTSKGETAIDTLATSRRWVCAGSWCGTRSMARSPCSPNRRRRVRP